MQMQVYSQAGHYLHAIISIQSPESQLQLQSNINITSDLSNLLPFMPVFSGCMAGKPYVRNPDTQR